MHKDDTRTLKDKRKEKLFLHCIGTKLALVQTATIQNLHRSNPYIQVYPFWIRESFPPVVTRSAIKFAYARLVHVENKVYRLRRVQNFKRWAFPIPRIIRKEGLSVKMFPDAEHDGFAKDAKDLLTLLTLNGRCILPCGNRYMR